MRGTSRDHLAGLASLHRVSDPVQREAMWRQSIATLASFVIDQRRHVPLEGLNPDSLLRSIQTAIKAGYLDSLDWLSAQAAAAALYEIAAALPASNTKRKMGRMLVRRLHEGDAHTFTALATQLALGSQRALQGEANHARIALALQLPFSAGVQTDALALALISRKETCQQWLGQPSTGSLPSRRLAARLLEHAARQAVRLAAEGDDSGVRIFCASQTRESWDRLLYDRESLVWRHVAAARGLLSTIMPAFDEEIQRHLSPNFTITEWRRAAASVAASIALQPNEGLAQCRQTLESTIFAQDRGIGTAMIYAMAPAADSQPYAVTELLVELLKVGDLDSVEAYVGLRRELGDDFANEALQPARDILTNASEQNPDEDLGRIALAHALSSELDLCGGPTLSDRLNHALEKYAADGTQTITESVDRILNAAESKVAVLENAAVNIGVSRDVFSALRELDSALFENDVLTNLLILQRSEQQSHGERRLGDIFQRVTNWLVIEEGNPLLKEGAAPHFTARLRQLRTLLHLVDADGRQVDSRFSLVRQRRMLTAKVLLRRTMEDVRTPLQRALFATTARACDALVREELVEISDVIIAVANHIHDHRGLKTMAEASMVPEIESALVAYARFFESVKKNRKIRHALDALQVLGDELPVARSPRVTALRSALLRLHRALSEISRSHSLSEIIEDNAGTPLASLEESTRVLSQFVRGAQRRLGDINETERLNASLGVRLVGVEVERALRASVSQIDTAVRAAFQALERALPSPFAEVIKLSLLHLTSIPIDAPRRNQSSDPIIALRATRLPAWVPPNRLLGGFYLLRSIGTGAVGSVFVARRIEDRSDENAEQFALKVPDYSGAAARTLSEEEFMRMFREEAGALLALPEHPNIARFVTFDIGAKPKPILAMELVQGPSLERMLEMDEITTQGAIDLLLAIGAGLDAMHRVGIGHLDVKPSNIIVRDPYSLTSPGGKVEPVLVDFGLAGRKLRPGCGTAHYGAPEIWGATDNAKATPADVYAFGCLAYEALTGQTLFDADSELQLIAMHIHHDGDPEPVAALASERHTYDLAEFLRQCLRRNPADRVTMAQARQLLTNLKPQLSAHRWPIPPAP